VSCPQPLLRPVINSAFAEGLPDLFGLRAPDSSQLAAALLVWCKRQPRGDPSSAATRAAHLTLTVGVSHLAAVGRAVEYHVIVIV
jgi:hypothetical protein